MKKTKNTFKLFDYFYFVTWLNKLFAAVKLENMINTVIIVSSAEKLGKFLKVYLDEK